MEKVEVDIVSVNIKPLEDRIVVKPLDAEQTTASGLVIPDTAKEKPQEGEVLAIGPGRVDDNGNRVPLDVAVGDKVIYSKYGGTEVKYGGEELPHPLRARRARCRFLISRVVWPEAAASGCALGRTTRTRYDFL